MLLLAFRLGRSWSDDLVTLLLDLQEQVGDGRDGSLHLSGGIYGVGMRRRSPRGGWKQVVQLAMHEPPSMVDLP